MTVDGLLRILRPVLVSPACSFCAGRSANGMVCDGCRSALPRNSVACPVCAVPLAGPVEHPCGRCANDPPHYDRSYSPFVYAAPIAQAIHGLKYHAQFRQARWLGAELATHLDSSRGEGESLPDLVLPVPLHASRLRSRGYNQALELARGIARVLPIPIDHHLAQRNRATEDQIGQRADARRRAVRGAFTVGAAIRDKHVAIVDDVMTTGSTVDELARACKAAGAVRVEVWVAARAP